MTGNEFTIVFAGNKLYSGRITAKYYDFSNTKSVNLRQGYLLKVELCNLLKTCIEEVILLIVLKYLMNIVCVYVSFRLSYTFSITFFT